MTKKRKAILTALFFIGGILGQSWLQAPIFILTYAAAGCFIIWLLYYFGDRQWKLKGQLGLWLLAVFLLGMWRLALTAPPVLTVSDQPVTISGRIIFVDTRLDRQDLTIKVTTGVWSGLKVLVGTDRYPLYHYGQPIELTCVFRRPQAFNDFAYDKYLALRQIYLTCSYPRLKIVGPAQGWRRLLFNFKEFYSSRLNYLPEPVGSFLRAMLLAERQEVASALLKDFSPTSLRTLFPDSSFPTGTEAKGGLGI